MNLNNDNGIKCGHCGGRHETITAVKACGFAAAPDDAAVDNFIEGNDFGAAWAAMGSPAVKMVTEPQAKFINDLMDKRQEPNWANAGIDGVTNHMKVGEL